MPLLIPITRNLHVLAWNVYSVADKKAELKLLLRANNIDVVVISETKLLPKYKFAIQEVKVY
jgi:exonuclease III